MQAAAHNGKYDIVRQAGMDLVKIHHDLENEKQPRPIVQKPAPPLDYQQFSPKPLRSHSQPAQSFLFPLDSQHLPPQPLTPSPLAQESPSPLNYHQLPLNPFQLVQKSVPQLDSQQFFPKPPQQPFSTGSKMRADASAGPKSGFKMRTAVFKWL
jgi:hypothetical protein